MFFGAKEGGGTTTQTKTQGTKTTPELQSNISKFIFELIVRGITAPLWCRTEQ